MRFKLFVLSLVGPLVLLFGTAAPVLAATSTTTPTPASSQVCAGVPNAHVASDGTCQVTGSPTLNNVVATAVNVLSMIVGLAGVIMVVMGGFKYITSGGDGQKAAGAKNTLVYAVIGLVIAALAQVLVQFVIKKST